MFTARPPARLTRAALTYMSLLSSPTQIGMYLVSEVWYLAIAGFYYACWKKDWLIRYRIQKKAAMPASDLISVSACAPARPPSLCPSFACLLLGLP